MAAIEAKPPPAMREESMRYKVLTRLLVGAAALLLAATSAVAQTPVKIRMQTAVP